MEEIKIVNVRKIDATPCAFMATINCPHCARPVDVFFTDEDADKGGTLADICMYCAGTIVYKVVD